MFPGTTRELLPQDSVPQRPTAETESTPLSGATGERAAPERVALGSPSSAPASPAQAQGAPAPAARVEGFVRTLEGLPLAGLDVIFEEQRGSGVESGQEVLATSGADGSFTVPLPESAGWLSVLDDEYAPLARPHLDGLLPAEPVVIVVALGYAYAGEVLDPDGEPVPQAHVEITLPGDWLRSFEVSGDPVHVLVPFAETRTDAAGHFAFEGVGFLPGIEVVAQRDGFAEARSALPAAPTNDLSLRLGLLEVGAFVHGVVLDASGARVGDARVSMGSQSVRTDVEGSFALPRDNWVEEPVVQAVKHGHLPGRARLEASRSAGTSALDPLELRLGGVARSIEGRVLDADGEPVEGVAVYTPDTTFFGQAVVERDGLSSTTHTTVEALARGSADAWHRPLETRTDAEGRFTLTGLLDRKYALARPQPSATRLFRTHPGQRPRSRRSAAS